MLTEEQIQRKSEIASFSRKEINAHVFLLEEEQHQYEQTIRTLQQQNKQLEAFKKYWSELYGEGLEIANWHQNGDTEPFDNFFDSAEEEARDALRRIQGKEEAR